MRTNIQDVLSRGEKIDRILIVVITVSVSYSGSCPDVQNLSNNLLSESKKFESQAKYINLMAFWRSYAPLIVIVLLVCLVIYFRFFR